MPPKPEQAVALCQEAERLLKPKGWLFPKADPGGAAEAYEKSGNVYKAHQDKSSAAQMFEKAVEVYAAMGGDYLFKMATLCESAAHLLKDGVDPNRAAVLYDKAAFFYRQNGTDDGARAALLKAVKIPGLGHSALEGACRKLITLAVDDDAFDACLDPSQTLVKSYIQARDIAKAVEAVESQIVFKEKAGRMVGIHKDVVTLCLLHLGTGDAAAATLAQREYMRLAGFLESDECALADRIIQAFDAGDGDGFDRALDSHVARTLPREVYAYGRGLKVPGGRSRPQPAGEAPATAPASAAADDDGAESDNSDL